MKNTFRLLNHISIFLLMVALCMPATAASLEDMIKQAMTGDHRDEKNVARDDYRHPGETLTFMGVTPDMTVVEIWPSRGWYTEILAPVLREKGKYYAASFSPSAKRTPDWRKTMHKNFLEKLQKRPDVYDRIIITELSVPEQTRIAPPGSVDMVLTFRNVHNWMNGDYAEEMFVVMSRALKSGGILGVTEHRAKPGTSIYAMKKSGYITEAHVIALAKQAGLVLEEKSEINANPKDSKDHPKGVWTLPPSLRHCRSMENQTEKNRCMDKYQPIGESDRMTLRFRKSG
ncbi:MAG: methyltransferase [Proteobacteria bacterium]|nr:methyltransferase [Pseudomonadota bacterium]